MPQDKEFFISKFEKLRDKYCHIGQTHLQYFQGLERAIIEGTAEALVEVIEETRKEGLK